MKNVQKKVTKKVDKKSVKKVKATKSVEKALVPKRPASVTDSLKAAVEEAKLKMDKVKVEASELQKKALELLKEAKSSYRAALLPYKEACKEAGVECEYSAGRLSNVSGRVVFLTEKVDGGIKVAIKGRPDTERVISAEELNISLNRAAYSFTDAALGGKEEVGNKGGTLSNRLRRLWK